jgi:hypothetical protein
MSDKIMYIPAGRRFEPVPGAHAEVQGVTSKGLLGHGQKGYLMITRPGKRPFSRKVKGAEVSAAMRFAERFNAAVAQAAAGAGEDSAAG